MDGIRCGSGLSTGGSLGEIQRGQLDADFEDAAFKANPNSIIGPITTAHGHHLILVCCSYAVVHSSYIFFSPTKLLSFKKMFVFLKFLFK